MLNHINIWKPQTTRLLFLLFVFIFNINAIGEPTLNNLDLRNIVVYKRADNTIRVEYDELPSSGAYSPGVDYHTDGKTLTVKLLWCAIEINCSSMKKSAMVKADFTREKEYRDIVNIPYHGEDIVFFDFNGDKVNEPITIKQEN